MKELIVYFYDNVICIVYQNKIIEKKLDSIYQGLVVDRTKFMESFLAILKKEKIKSKLFGDKIYVVRDAYYSVRDLYYLESMFVEMGFINIVQVHRFDNTLLSKREIEEAIPKIQDSLGLSASFCVDTFWGLH